MRTKGLSITVAAITAAALGCAKSEVEAPDPPSAPAIEAHGEVRPEFVGTWKYILGTYTFTKDGSYDVHFDYKRPAGPGQGDTRVVGDEKGDWKADDKYVYFKSSRGAVIRDTYKFGQGGAEVDLLAKSAKSALILRRTSPSTGPKK